MGALEKQRHILDFTLNSLGRRRGRNIALILIYGLVIFLLASVLFGSAALKHEAGQILKEAPEITVQRLVAGRQDLVPKGYIDSIAAIRGVRSVTPRQWGYYFDSYSGANYTLMVKPELNDHPGEILIGGGVARRGAIGGGRQRLSKGDLIPFKTYDGVVHSLMVAGVLPADSELATADLILMAESDFRALFALDPHYATDLVLKVGNPKELTTIAAKIAQMHPDSRTILRDDILRTYAALFDWRGGLVMLVLCGAFLAFFLLAWDKATGLSAEEKREIGILKAVGWDTADILQMKFWEGAVVSLTAFIFGILAAYVHVFFFSAALFAPVLKGWSTLYPHFRLTPAISLYQIGVLFFLTVLPYTVITIVPSWRSASIDPDTVMRT